MRIVRIATDRFARSNASELRISSRVERDRVSHAGRGLGRLRLRVQHLDGRAGGVRDDEGPVGL
ncbi:hypothetical protein, partial [Streptomyces sp. NPDC001274]